MKYKKCICCGLEWNVSSRDNKIPYICPNCENKVTLVYKKPSRKFRHNKHKEYAIKKSLATAIA